MKRLSRFPIEQLPATFQDAISVTQEIVKRYLWIDSLCIFQGDQKNWETEAKKMETVFKIGEPKGYYCISAVRKHYLATQSKEIRLAIYEHLFPGQT